MNITTSKVARSLCLIPILLLISACDGWSTLEPDDSKFRVEFPDSTEEKTETTLFRILEPRDRSVVGAAKRRGYLVDEWLTFHSWRIHANRFPEAFLVGYNPIPAASLDRLSDDQILEELIGSSHLVRGAGFGPDPIRLSHKLPAMETVFSANGPGGGVRATKRVYLSRKHERAFIVVYIVRTNEHVEDSSVNRQRFLDSFEVTD